jgi:hypothetical protein
MPLKTGELTRKEEDFARAYAESGFDIAAAEKAAGYRPGVGRQAASRPAIVARAEEYARAKLVELDLLGIQWAEEAMRDPKRGDAIKRDIWKIVRNSRDTREPDRQKDAAEMTAEELAEAMERLERERAKLAQDVTAEEAQESLFD